MRAGLGYLRTTDANVLADEAVYVGFDGVGARLGLGLELSFSPRIGLVGDLEYRSCYGAPGVPLDDRYVVADNTAQLGAGSVGLALHFGPIGLAAGPEWSFGRLEVTGATCPSCGIDAEPLAYQRMQADVLFAGGYVRFAYAVASGPKTALSVELQGGQGGNSWRSVTWAGVGLSFGANRL